MRWPALFMVLLFVGLRSSPQAVDSVKLTGQVTMDSEVPLTPTVSLVPYKEGENSMYAGVDKDGAFSFTVPVKEKGLYELKYRKYGVSVLLSPGEPLCKVIIKAGADGVRTMKTVGSRENDAYKVLKRDIKFFDEVLTGLIHSCISKDKSCLATAKKKIEEQNQTMQYFRMSFVGTFAVDVLASLAELPGFEGSTAPVAWLQQHFFDKDDLKDKKLYITTDLDNKLSFYLDNLVDTTLAGRSTFVESFLNKTSDDKEGQKLSTSLLFLNITGDDREPFVQTLVGWASQHPALATDQPVMASKIKLAARVVPGSPAPDVTGKDLDDKQRSLLEIAKKNKLTLLIFWESDCPHCRKAMPEFIRLYKQYHPQGLDVFAASLDTEKAKWKQFVADNHLEWNNVNLPSNSSAHSDYFIQYTPTVVLINSAGTIVRRFIDVADLDKSIAGILGQ